jgi:hypothetical protein
MRNKGRPKKDRSWWPVIVAAIIGAVATVTAGLIANGAGALSISVTPDPAHTVTVSPAPAPTVTVTASPGSGGGIGTISCTNGQTCKVWEPVVPVSNLASGYPNGIDFSTGKVTLQTDGDLDYGTSSLGTPELKLDQAAAVSLDVTAQNASKAQCQTATNSSPDAVPITNLHTGLLFCVATGSTSGIALVEQTGPLTSTGTLPLKEIFWPSS